MKESGEYFFSIEGRRVTIKTGKVVEADGRIIYYARSDFRHVSAIAEDPYAVLEKCVKKIKFNMKRVKKEIELMKYAQAAALAGKFFQENYSDRTAIKNHLDTLGSGFSVEDEILTFSVWKYKGTGGSDGLYNDTMPENMPDTVAIVYVNLLTGECDMIENKERLV